MFTVVLSRLQCVNKVLRGVFTVFVYVRTQLSNSSRPGVILCDIHCSAVELFTTIIFICLTICDRGN